jgi:hypothetical protein
LERYIEEVDKNLVDDFKEFLRTFEKLTLAEY